MAGRRWQDAYPGTDGFAPYANGWGARAAILDETLQGKSEACVVDNQCGGRVQVNATVTHRESEWTDGIDPRCDRHR